MYRKAMQEIEAWKHHTPRKPLLVHGARQVGKTWLMEEFGRLHFSTVASILMASNPRMRSLFKDNTDARSIISGLEAEAGISIDPQETLIILDEIQEVPDALAALKYLYEQTPQYHIMVAGSLLGVLLNENISFPVGKVDSLYLYPLDFPEFVRAVESEQMATLLLSDNEKLQLAFHEKLNDLLRAYYLIGGMPEVVNNYASNRDFIEARRIQKQIIRDYEHDFGKHVPTSLIPRLHMVFDSIPSQLAKENKKFLYSVLKTGARAKEYELAIAWLADSGILTKVPRVTKVASPLKHYEDLSAFKLFLVDVGLLAAMSEIDPKILMEQNSIIKEFRGALTEQYVLQQMVASGITPYYYSSADSKSELDFVIEQNGRAVPLEVKSATNTKSRSLANYLTKQGIQKAVKFTMNPPRHNEVIQNLPLYTAATIGTVLADQ
jgi:predicted AAA+ superfamily ATPase